MFGIVLSWLAELRFFRLAPAKEYQPIGDWLGTLFQLKKDYNSNRWKDLLFVNDDEYCQEKTSYIDTISDCLNALKKNHWVDEGEKQEVCYHLLITGGVLFLDAVTDKELEEISRLFDFNEEELFSVCVEAFAFLKKIRNTLDMNNEIDLEFIGTCLLSLLMCVYHLYPSLVVRLWREESW